MSTLSEKQKALLELRREIRILSRAESNLVADLQLECNHPDAHVEEYRWESDNGYGRQTQMTGRFCTLCRARKYYTLGGSWTFE